MLDKTSNILISKSSPLNHTQVYKKPKILEDQFQRLASNNTKRAFIQKTYKFSYIINNFQGNHNENRVCVRLLTEESLKFLALS